MLAEGEYNPSQGTSSKNDEKDQNHYVPPEMEPPVFSIGSIHHSQHAEVKLGAFQETPPHTHNVDIVPIPI